MGDGVEALLSEYPQFLPPVGSTLSSVVGGYCGCCSLQCSALQTLASWGMVLCLWGFKIYFTIG